MKVPALPTSLLLTLASLALPVTAFHAESRVWNAADGTWATDPGLTPWSGLAWEDGNTAVFSNNSALNVTVEGTVRPEAITFGGNSAFNLNNGTIDFGDTAGVLDGTARTYKAGFLSINSNLAGNQGVTIRTSVYAENSTSLFILAGDNRGLTGGINLDGGHVTLNSAHALGGNTLTLTNGGGLGLFYDGVLSVGNDIVLGAGGGSLRTWGTRTATFSGTLSGTGDLWVGAPGQADGAGTYGTIAFTNTVNTSGDLLARNGHIRFLADATFGNTSFATNSVAWLASGVTLDFTGGSVNLTVGQNGHIVALDNVATGVLTSSSGTLTINAVDTAGNLATGVLTQSSHRVGVRIADAATPLKLVKNGSDQLFLEAANTYSGGTEIIGGRLNIAHTQALGSGDVLVRDGGKAHITQAGTYQNNFILNGSGTRESSGYFGALQMDGSAASPVIIAGNVTLASDARITQYDSGHHGTINGSLLGTGNLEKNGAGVLVLAGENSGYSGDITISAGTLQIGAGGTSGNLASGSALINNGSLALNRADAQTFANTISGTGALIHSGTGTTTLTGINTYSGATTLSAGTVVISSLGDTATGGNLGTSGQINLHGGTLRYTGDSASTGRAFNANGGDNGGTLEVTNAGATLTLAGAFSSANGKAITKTGEGTLVLTGTADNNRASVIVNEGTLVLAKNGSDTARAIGYALTINSGTVRLNGTGADQISNNSPVTMSGGVFDMNGKNEALGVLNGTGGTVTNTATGTTSTLTLGDGNYSNTNFSGALQNGAGTLALTKAGTGTAILSGDNTHTGATAITGGTLQIGTDGNTGSLGGTHIAISSGATLAVNRAGTLVLDGAISGAGQLVKTGSGTLVLTNGSTFSGGTVLNEGSLALDFSAPGAPAGNILAAGSTLTLGRQTELVVRGGSAGSGLAQTFSAINLTGDATVRIEKGAASRVDVQLGALNLNGFSLNFAGADTALSGGTAVAGTANFLTSTVAGANDGATRLGNALWNGSGWASTAGNGGDTYVVAWQGAYTEVFSKNDTLLEGAASDVRIVNGTGGTAGANLVLGSATTSINSLLIAADDTAATLSLAGTNNTLVLAAGDLALGANARSFTLGATANEGGITAGASGSARLRLTNASDSATLTVNSVIKDNAGGGAVGLDIGGIGATVLTGTGTYTGSTTIGGSATLRITGAGSLGGGSYAGALSSEGTLHYASAAAQKLSGEAALNGALILDNNNLSLAATDKSVTQVVNARVSGAGTLNKTGAGSLLIGGSESNTNTGGIKIDFTGATYGAAGAGSFIYFAKTNGAVAVAGNAVLEFTSSAAGNNSVVMLENNQFGAGVVANFNTPYGRYVRLNLNGTDQTLAGINTGDLSSNGGGVIQNDGIYSESRGESTLTLNGSGNYLFSGHFRDVEDNALNTAYKLNLVKDGTGTQTLASHRINYSGTTDIRGGTLEFTKVTSGSALVSDTTVRAGATLKYSENIDVVVSSNIILAGGTAQFSTTSALALQTGAIGGGGTLVKDGSGNLEIRSAAIALDSGSLIDIQTGVAANNYLVTDWSGNRAELRLGAGATFDMRGVRTTVGALTGGGTLINSANGGTEGVLGNVLTVGAGDGSGTYTGNIVAPGWHASGNASLGTARYSVDLRKVGAGTQVFAGHHAGASITIDGGTFQLGNSAGNGTTDAFRIVNNATLKVANDTAQTLSSAISGSGDLVKSGTGVLTLNNKNTYTGDTRIESGTLRLGSTSLAAGTTIMPFGDSITYGTGGTDGGYRGFLFNLLNNTGTGFAFVGEQRISPSTPGSLPGDQWAHSGISGDYLRNQIPGGSRNAIFNERIAMQPDAVLIHFGINDIQGGGETNQEVLKTRLTELIDTFIAGSPETTLFLAKIVPATNKTWNTETLAGFHATMEQLVAERQAAGKKIVLVDLNSDYPANSLPDKLHPNDTGYAWMARQWYNALMETMGVSDSEALPAGTNVSINAGATLDVNNRVASIGVLSGAGHVALGSGALILNSAENATFSGVISGTGLLVKSGTGTQTLTGANAYSGGTLVKGGTLLANGSLAGDVEVWDGATLGGTGAITGDVNILAGGTLSPGNSPGTLTFSGNVTLEAGARLVIEIGDGGTHDIIAFLGTGHSLTFEDGVELRVVNTGTPGDLTGDYQIFSGNVALSGPLQFADGAYVYTLDTSGNLNISVVPEPGTYALLVAVSAIGLAVLRRRRGQHARTSPEQ